MSIEVFISYSHEDLDRIDPIIELVRALKRGLVFQDRHWEAEWERDDNEGMQKTFETNTRQMAHLIVTELEKLNLEGS